MVHRRAARPEHLLFHECPVKVELVRATTTDGVFLDGAISDGQSGESGLPNTSAAFDGVLLLHGVGSNFYQPRLLFALAESLDRAGLRTLRVNTRGHDGVHTAGTLAGGRRFGSALELVHECVHDIDAWLAFMEREGCQRILLLGHSLGAIKSVYWTAKSSHPSVAAVAALSPPRLSAAAFAGRGEESGYFDSLARAQQQIAAGRGEDWIEASFPFPMTMSANTYVDKYGGERYNILRLVAKCSAPTLFTYGEQELNKEAFRGLPEQLQASGGAEVVLDVVVLPGADHSYSGHVPAVLQVVENRLATHLERNE